MGDGGYVNLYAFKMMLSFFSRKFNTLLLYILPWNSRNFVSLVLPLFCCSVFLPPPLHQLLVLGLSQILCWTIAQLSFLFCCGWFLVDWVFVGSYLENFEDFLLLEVLGLFVWMFCYYLVILLFQWSIYYHSLVMFEWEFISNDSLSLSNANKYHAFVWTVDFFPVPSAVLFWCGWRRCYLESWALFCAKTGRRQSVCNLFLSELLTMGFVITIHLRFPIWCEMLF